LLTLVALAAGVVYLRLATPLYTSTARIYVEQTGPKALGKDTSGAIARWDAYLQTQAELIQGSETLAAALKSPALAALRTFTESANPMATLRRGLNVVVGKRDEIINVSFTSPYPGELADVVNTVVGTYIDSSNRRKVSLSADVVKIIEQERAKRDAELNEKRQKMLDFELKNEGLVSGANQNDNIVLRTLERLRLALIEAQLTTLDTKSFHEMCKRMAHDPSGLRKFVETRGTRETYIAAGQTTVLRSDLQRLERERADCLKRLRPDTPAIAALDAEKARIEQQLIDLDVEFAATQLTVAEQQYLAAQEREQELNARFEQQRREAVQLNDRLAQYALLRSDYEQTKGFRDLLNERIRVLGVDPQVGLLNVEIVEAAQPPGAPSHPQAAKTLSMALCLGLFIGMGLSLYLEGKSQRLHSTQEISSLLELPILGVIPSMTFPKQTPAIRGQKVRISPDSREAEAFRMIRTALFYRGPSEAVKTILVTSPAMGEGKSTVASNLAISIAHAGQKVVLVDADLRQPTQHVLFALKREAGGLSSVLAGKMPLDQAIQPTGIENLSVLACGPAIANPAEVVNSGEFARVVRQLAEKYDRVLIDSPPVAAVADAQILATLCDATLLVLRVRTSTRRVSLQAHNSLAGVEARILGVIVNDVPPNGDQYGYYGHYGYHGHSRKGGNGARASRTGPREPQKAAVPVASTSLSL
jgi:capsular exopolysaccharide synthesis family protein